MRETKQYICILLIMILCLCTACASTKGSKVGASQAPRKVKPKITPAPAAPVEETVKKPAEKPLDVSLPAYKPEKALKDLPPKEPIDPKKLVKGDTPVLINAESMPLSSFIVYAIGDVLKVTFVLDEAVMNMKNPVTIKMSQPLPPDKVMEIVLGFLAKYDLNLEEKAGALYISKTKPPVSRPVDVRVGRRVPDSPSDILQVVPLRHIRANEVDGLIRDVYKTGVTVKLYQKDNALLLSGPASAVRDIIDFLEVFDVPYMQGKRPFLIKLTYWQVDDFIKQISSILDGLGFSIAKNSKDAGIFIIPVKVLNSALVVAPDDASMKYVLDWVARLDTPESAGTEEKSFVYSPKFSKASDLVDSLDKVYGVTDRTGLASGSQSTTSTGTQSTTATGTYSTTTPSTQSTTSSQQRRTSTLARPGVLAAPGLRVAADDRRNIILISATPSKYKNILSYLASLDAPPKQVLIEATIAELTLKGDLKYGLEWYMNNTMTINGTGGSYGLGTLTNKLGGLGVDTKSGLAYTFTAANNSLQIVFNALASDNRINILSSPRIMVIDNQEAHIQIGTDVPILSGSTTSTSETTQNVITTQAIQYRSTGLMVTVKPNINTEGMLTLEITLESSDAQTNTLSSVNSPIILTRKLNTNVVAASEQTIVIGGIMSENLSDTETKVPLLGDIPFIGNAFKNTSKSKTKTELVMTLKPIIITNTDDAASISADVKQGLKWLK